MRGDDEIVALRRWITPAYKPRKDVPRTYEGVTDEELSNLLRQTNQTLAVITRLDQKCFDSLPEAQRIRALSTHERQKLRKELLAMGTRLRDEFRRRAAPPGTASK